MLLFQAKQVHLGGHVGGVDDVQPVRHQTLASGLLYHLVEQALETLGSQALPETAEHGVIGRQFLSAQAQEGLEEQVPGALLLNVPVREVVEELQENHFEHEHRVPGVPAPIHVKVFQGRFDKGEVHGSGEIGEEMGAATQQLIVNEAAEEGAVGAAGLAHEASGKIYFPDITTSYVFWPA